MDNNRKDAIIAEQKAMIVKLQDQIDKLSMAITSQSVECDTQQPKRKLNGKGLAMRNGTSDLPQTIVGSIDLCDTSMDFASADGRNEITRPNALNFASDVNKVPAIQLISAAVTDTVNPRILVPSATKGASAFPSPIDDPNVGVVNAISDAANGTLSSLPNGSGVLPMDVNTVSAPMNVNEMSAQSVLSSTNGLQSPITFANIVRDRSGVSPNRLNTVDSVKLNAPSDSATGAKPGSSTEKVAGKRGKLSKPTPIQLGGMNKEIHDTILRELMAKFGDKFYWHSVGRGLPRIFAADFDVKDEIMRWLVDGHYEFNTYTERGQKRKSFLVRGLAFTDDDVNIKSIADAITLIASAMDRWRHSCQTIHHGLHEEKSKCECFSDLPNYITTRCI